MTLVTVTPPPVTVVRSVPGAEARDLGVDERLTPGQVGLEVVPDARRAPVLVLALALLDDLAGVAVLVAAAAAAAAPRDARLGAGRVDDVDGVALEGGHVDEARRRRRVEAVGEADVLRLHRAEEGAELLHRRALDLRVARADAHQHVALDRRGAADGVGARELADRQVGGRLGVAITIVEQRLVRRTASEQQRDTRHPKPEPRQTSFHGQLPMLC